MPLYRLERDSLGEIRVPEEAYYGAQTQRAVENFPISGQRFPRRFIWALGLVKRSVAEANEELLLIDVGRAEWIATAAQEVMDGRFDDEFVVDIFQTGSGTSTNMNANEVISNRGIEMMGGERGSRDPIHPNDHVNMGQSSNDVIPTALHISAAVAIKEELLPALTRLLGALDRKAREFDDVVKTGRTHLMDATPVRLGQEFGGWAAQVAHARRRAEAARDALLELPLGGTAVGTGINRHPEMPANAIARIADECELPFREAANHFESQGARDAAVEASGQLKAIAVGLTKIANDIRWLASGPRTGLGELRLPALAPGSSIMPGKVNPVMAEMVVMACAQVIGNDAATTLGGLGGTLELNAMIPLIAHNLLQSITLLSNASRTFAEKCVDGIEADREACAATVERNLSLATALVPELGYDGAAAIAKKAHASGRTVRDVATEEGVLPAPTLADALDPRRMTEPGT
ncbi:MAG: class II fumarate hydratase [Myxococcota bacterium]|nr:class II fumarate hydratase [Myxococcota bacterium]MEC8425481.1 class II fumarate hydratase [Myxococcota bacterium]